MDSPMKSALLNRATPSTRFALTPEPLLAAGLLAEEGARRLVGACLMGNRQALEEAVSLPDTPELGTVPHALLAAVRALREADEPVDTESLWRFLVARMGHNADFDHNVAVYMAEAMGAATRHPRRCASDIRAFRRELERQALGESLGGRIRAGGDCGDLLERLAELRAEEEGGALRPDSLWQEVPAPALLFQNGMEAGQVGVVTAGSGGRKTWLCCGLAASLALGRPLVSPSLAPGGRVRAALATFEDHPHNLRRRLDAIAEAHGAEPAELHAAMEEGWLNIFCMGGRPFWEADPATGQPRGTAHLDGFLEFCRSRGAGFAAVDPLISACCGVDVAGNREMSRIMGDLVRWSARTGCSVLLTHHDGKSDQGGPKSGLGATAIPAKARWVAQLRPGKTEDRFELVVWKNPAGFSGMKIPLRGAASGCLIADADTCDPALLAEEMVRWLGENPEARVVLGAFHNRFGDAGRLMRALNIPTQWALDAVEYGVRAGLLHRVEEHDKSRNRSVTLITAADTDNCGEAGEDPLEFPF